MRFWFGLFFLGFFSISTLNGCLFGSAVSEDDSGDKGDSSTVAVDCEQPQTTCDSIPASGGTIQSFDNKLVMTIPDGANQEVTRYSIQKVTLPDSVPDSVLQLADSIMIFEVGPDGMEFEKPIDFKFDLGEIKRGDSNEVLIPTVTAYHLHKDTLSPIDSLGLTLENGNVLAGFTLSKFSKVFIRTQPPGFHVGFTKHHELEVGDTLNPTLFFLHKSIGMHESVRYTIPSREYNLISNSGVLSQPREIAFLSFDPIINEPYKQEAILETTCLSEGVEGIEITTQIKQVSTPSDIVQDLAAFFVPVNIDDVEENITYFQHDTSLTVTCVKTKPQKFLEGVYQINQALVGGALEQITYIANFANWTNVLAIAGNDRVGIAELDSLKIDSSIQFIEELLNDDPNPTFGFVGISYPDPGPNTSALAFGYGAGGVAYMEYFPGSGFGLTTLWPGGVLDASPIGGQIVAPGMIYIGEDEVGRIIAGPNPDLPNENFYSDPDNDFKISDFPGASKFKTAFQTSLDGEMLIVTEDTSGGNSLHTVKMKEDTTRADVDPITGERIGSLGTDIKKLRCAGQICLASDFQENKLHIVKKGDSPDASPQIIGAEPVGDGPVGFEVVYDSTTQNYQVVITGFNDNSYSTLSIDGNGSVTSNEKENLPEGCDMPGHAAFIKFEDPGLGYQVMVSCHNGAIVIKDFTPR